MDRLKARCDFVPRPGDGSSAGAGLPLRASAPAVDSSLTQARVASLGQRRARGRHQSNRSWPKCHSCPGKLPYSAGLHHAHGNPSTLQCSNQNAFIASAGFANHLHLPSDCFKQTEELFCSGHIIRQTMELFFPRHIQMRFSHINSDIDNFLLHGFNYSCVVNAS